MDWVERLNEAISYIEENLEREIDYGKAAKIAGCSTYHFQRMFSYISEVPLSEYIRRRRMTLAAFDLQSGDEKIIELAMKYGYESPTSFSRAFQTMHGMTPKEARKEGVSLTAYPRISFHVSIQAGEEMKYRIEKKNAIRVVGVKKHFELSLKDCFANVPLFWKKSLESGMVQRVAEQINQEPYGMMGISVGTGDKDKSFFDFDYYIAAPTTKEVSKGMDEYNVPASLWAIFEGEGDSPDVIQNIQKRVVTEWLPTSGYEYADLPDIEVYFGPANKFEIWLPIMKRKES